VSESVLPALLPALLPGAAFFHVDEEPAYAADGTGEHLYVHIEKEGLTTDAVVEQLAKVCGVRHDAVGFAGRKDRHAVTRQWFSIHFGKEEQLAGLDGGKGRVQVLAISRHRNKLRLGHLAGNSFRLGLTNIADPAALQARLNDLGRTGIANRFGSQRFGVAGATLRAACAYGAGNPEAAIAIALDPAGVWTWGDPLPTGFRAGPEGRLLGQLRSGGTAARALRQSDQLVKLWASAAQSAVFNAVAEARASSGLTHALRAGDIACTPKGAPFVVAEVDVDDVNRRVAAGILELFATGPLPGTTKFQPSATVVAEEQAWAAGTGVDWSWFAAKAPLESPGDRRQLVVPFRVAPTVTVVDAVTWVAFGLPSGSYATEVLTQVGVAIPDDRRG